MTITQKTVIDYDYPMSAMNPTQTSLKPTPMLLIWQWICFLSRPTNTGESQPITN